MTTTDKNISGDLYELSGWGREELLTELTDDYRESPSYSLDFLIDKLPNSIRIGTHKYSLRLAWNNEDKVWYCQYRDWTESNAKFTQKSTNPQDAMKLVAIELFKMGYLE